MAINTPIVYHQGVWVKNTSRGCNKLRYTKPLSPFVNAIKPGWTVKAFTPSAIGCLIDNFHSSGNEPMFEIFESINVIIKKTMNDGII